LGENQIFYLTEFGIFQIMHEKIRNIIRELHNFGDNKCFSQKIFSRDEIQKYLRKEKE